MNCCGILDVLTHDPRLMNIETLQVCDFALRPKMTMHNSNYVHSKTTY